MVLLNNGGEEERSFQTDPPVIVGMGRY